MNIYSCQTCDRKVRLTKESYEINPYCLICLNKQIDDACQNICKYEKLFIMPLIENTK